MFWLSDLGVGDGSGSAEPVRSLAWPSSGLLVGHKHPPHGQPPMENPTQHLRVAVRASGAAPPCPSLCAPACPNHLRDIPRCAHRSDVRGGRSMKRFARDRQNIGSRVGPYTCMASASFGKHPSTSFLLLCDCGRNLEIHDAPPGTPNTTSIWSKPSEARRRKAQIR